MKCPLRVTFKGLGNNLTFTWIATMTDKEEPYANGAVHGNTLVITILVEEIRDADTSYGLRDEMLSLIDPATTSRVVIDFGDVTFVGSVGFLAFLALRRRLKNEQIVICNLADSVRLVFEICRLISNKPSSSSPFEVADSLEAALARCSG
jgi:anti-anti-sigma factor